MQFTRGVRAKIRKWLGLDKSPLEVPFGAGAP